MSNVAKPDTQTDAARKPAADEAEGGRRWPIIRGRSWRVVLNANPITGLTLKLERTDHAQS